MLGDLQKEIINKLSDYGQQGCYVNELFGNLRCSKNDFVDAKNQLVKQGVIGTKKEGKQRIRLSLNSGYFSELDKAFHQTLKHYEAAVGEVLKQLRRIKPLFEHAEDKNELPGLKVTNQYVSKLLGNITGMLEEISDYTMAFTLQYYIDPRARRANLKENQRLGFETMRKIIEKLIEQHKDEEEELRNYLLWGTTSSFSYVF